MRLAGNWRTFDASCRSISGHYQSVSLRPESQVEVTVVVDTIRLGQLRESKSWSQEHLANAAGLSLRTVQRMERTGHASAESRLAVAAALGVPVDSLAMVYRPTSALETSKNLGFARGQLWAFGGIATGALSAAAVIVLTRSDGREMGIALGILGAVTGLACAFIGAFTQRCATLPSADA